MSIDPPESLASELRATLGQIRDTVVQTAVPDRVLGRVTSGGYGYTVGRNIFCAYVAVDEPVAAEYAIEVMGERHPALRHTRPLYDPDRRAILA